MCKTLSERFQEYKSIAPATYNFEWKTSLPKKLSRVQRAMLPHGMRDELTFINKTNISIRENLLFSLSTRDRVGKVKRILMSVNNEIYLSYQIYKTTDFNENYMSYQIQKVGDDFHSNSLEELNIEVSYKSFIIKGDEFILLMNES